jgi:hypothetical protein
MSRFELKTSLTAAQTVELLLDEEYSSIKGDHPQFKLANELYEGLIEEYEVAINCAEKSLLNITLPPIMGASDAQASKESLNSFFMNIGQVNFAKKITTNQDNLIISKSDLSELLSVIPTKELPKKFINNQLAVALNTSLSQNSRKTRTEPKHLDVIKVLLQFIPELKDHSKNKQFDLLCVMCANAGLEMPVELRTFQRW